MSAVATDSPRGGGRLSRWWGGLGGGQRIGVVVLLAVVALNLALNGMQAVVGRDPGGPVSSSFSTGHDGLEGYADLLADDGARVVRLRRPATSADLETADVVVMADPAELDATEVRRIIGWTRAGGTLVLAGVGVEPVVQAATGVVPGWTAVAPVRRLQVWVPGPTVGGAVELAGDGGGRWAGPGPLLPVAGGTGGVAVLRGPVDRGEVLALADASVLQNRALDQADNAAFALGAARPEGSPVGRTVLFVESVHGYGHEGFGAVPSTWKWAALGVALALVAGLWSAGARFGPPEPDTRALRPARREHVEAVAADLQRVAPEPAEAVAPLARSVRIALADELGLPEDASGPVLAAQARAAGYDTGTLAALDAEHLDLEGALAVGALAASRRRAALGAAAGEPAGTVAPSTEPPGASS